MNDIKDFLAAACGTADLSNRSDLLGHADRIWKMLDNLAETDPAGYASFLEDQAKTASSVIKAKSEPRTPVVIIHCSKDSQPEGKFLISLFVMQKDDDVPPATASGKAISTSTSTWKDVQIPFIPKQKLFSTARENVHWDIVELNCHPDVLQLAAAGTPPQLRAVLIEAAIRFVEQSHCCHLIRQSATLQIARTALSEAEVRAADAKQAVTVAQKVVQGTAAEGISTSLMAQLANIATPSQQGSKLNAAELPAKQQHNLKKPLIQEL